MNRLIVLLSGALLTACADPAPPPAATPAEEPEAGWTGRTHPEAVIEARQELMAHMEALMLPIDQARTGAAGDPARLRENAGVIGTMMHAVPHLFPPTTNLYEPANPTPPTVALPAVWKNFRTFQHLSEASIRAAESLAATEGGAQALRDGGAALRASCDSCHALFLRKYTPPVTQPSDYEFDFEAALPGKQ